MNKTDTARDYRKRFPDMPTHKLARIMYSENNLFYKDVEDARKFLRTIEGKSGNKYIDEKLKEFEVPNRPHNPYKLPESDETIYKPFVFPKHKKVGILSDIH